MFEKLEVFRVSQGLATHSAARQSTIARNVAHADTPGYRALDLVPFAESYRAQGTTGMRATRPGHVFAGESQLASQRSVEMLRPGALSPNGNSVSLETEIMMSAEVQHDHEVALSVYRSALNVLRTSVGR